MTGTSLDEISGLNSFECHVKKANFGKVKHGEYADITGGKDMYGMQVLYRTSGEWLKNNKYRYKILDKNGNFLWSKFGGKGEEVQKTRAKARAKEMVTPVKFANKYVEVQLDYTPLSSYSNGDEDNNNDENQWVKPEASTNTSSEINIEGINAIVMLSVKALQDCDFYVQVDGRTLSDVTPEGTSYRKGTVKTIINTYSTQEGIIADNITVMTAPPTGALTGGGGTITGITSTSSIIPAGLSGTSTGGGGFCGTMMLIGIFTVVANIFTIGVI